VTSHKFYKCNFNAALLVSLCVTFLFVGLLKLFHIVSEIVNYIPAKCYSQVYFILQIIIHGSQYKLKSVTCFGLREH